jgi:hypothetical protein
LIHTHQNPSKLHRICGHLSPVPSENSIRLDSQEAWLTLKSIGNTTVKPDELAGSVLRLAMEGERDPVRLHDGALEGLIPATAWREAS